MTTNLTAKQTEYIAAAPVLSRSLVQRAFEVSASPRQAQALQDGDPDDGQTARRHGKPRQRKN